MNRRIIYILVGLAFTFFITSMIIFLNSQKESRQVADIESIPDEMKKTDDIPEMTPLKFFFLTENSRFMRPVRFEMKSSLINAEMYKKFIHLLLIGREDYIIPIPEGIQLRTLYYIQKNNLLIVDFTEELTNRFPGGSTAELEFIYFIVNNICYNFKEIKKVKFMVMGNEYRTIAGHIDIENPFYPDFSYIRDRK